MTVNFPIIAIHYKCLPLNVKEPMKKLLKKHTIDFPTTITFPSVHNDTD